ncbi:hypothetical protein [Pedobacter sp. SL55]|uniref:hypothetical protein n=1 Tax=Pedobacter sp. SL55 TaxID=2995161 RepID=UPI00227073A6|nr:hypothetical protein [Pedobacter sp. SL55]WAC39868.1 hypothetical protein OVA16_14950 [Pedobacter sp. SL55]
MANLNYERRLANLKARRFDEILLKADVSESFGRAVVSNTLEYLVEAMRPIGKKYNDVTLNAASNVQSHLEAGFNLPFTRAYRKQGSVMTNTNIKLYSDIDLLTIIDSYVFLAPALLPPKSPYLGDTDLDIVQLRRQATSIMQLKYDEVDTSGNKSINIYNKNLRRKVDIVFSYWYDTPNYLSNNDEFYRGIHLYDFEKKQKQLDYPFAHIHNVNQKSSSTNDGSCKGIRLLKTLKVDAEKDIELSSFQLTTLVYEMDNVDLYYSRGNELKIAINMSKQMAKMITYPNYRRYIKSPNGMETPFFEDKCVGALNLLKRDLDRLIEDCGGEVNNYLTNSALLRYS